MADLILHPVRNVEMLSLGFNYEGTIDIANDVPAGGSVPVKFLGSDGATDEVVGRLMNIGLILEEAVPVTSTSGTDYTSYDLTLGDTADGDGLYDNVELLSGASGQLTVGNLYTVKGTGADDSLPIDVTDVDAVLLSGGDTDESNATGGRVRILASIIPGDGVPLNA